MFVNNDQMLKKKKCFSYPLPHFKDGIRNTQNVFNIFILLTLIGKSRDVFCTNYEPIKLRHMSVGSNPTLLFWGSIYHLHSHEPVRTRKRNLHYAEDYTLPDEVLWCHI